MEPVPPDHPQHVLLFALEGRPDDEASDEMLETVQELRRAHSWTVSPPELVDEVHDESPGESGEEGIRTVGLFVKVHSAHPPFEGRIPVTVERAEYEDVKMLVERLSRLSVKLQEEIIVEFAGEAIGWIEHGVPDTGLTDTFLDEWRKSIEAREAKARSIRRAEAARSAELELRAHASSVAEAFPHDALVANGTYRVTDHLRGVGSRQLWRAVRLADGKQALVAFDARLSRIPVAEMRTRLEARRAADVDLAYVGETDAPPPMNAHWLCVELPRHGTWLPDLLGEQRLSSAQAIDLTQSTGQLLARTLADGTVLAGVRPEYMWGVRDGERLAVTAASDRAYWLFAYKTYDMVTRPPFARDYAAPEARNEPSERSLVYSLAQLLVEWAGGVPAGLEQVLERAQSRDPADRPQLDAFLAALVGKPR